MKRRSKTRTSRITTAEAVRVPSIDPNRVKVAGETKLNAEVIIDKTVTLDASKAQEYVDLPIFAGERTVRDHWVQHLVDEMKKGTFNHLLVILSTAEHKGVYYKINGQHTCWAVAFMPPGFSIRVREIRYRCKSEKQLKLLYSTYDRLMGRTDGHITTVHLVGTDVGEGIPTDLLGRLATGVKFWLMANPEYRRVTPDQIAAVIFSKYPDLFRQVGVFITDVNRDASRFFKRQPVLAALFPTFEKVPTKAREFWHPVFTGLGLEKKTDARWQLRKWLLDTCLAKGTSGKSDQRSVTSEETYLICIVAWNRWRKGEVVQSLRPTKKRVKPV